MCSENFCKIYKKTPVSQPLNKVAGLRPTTLLKKETLAQVFSSEFLAICNILFTEHLWTTASERQCFHRLETSQWIYKANQLSGFYIVGTLVVSGLNSWQNSKGFTGGVL